MPELPEVETVRRGLELLTKGRTIDHVDVLYPPIVGNDLSGFEAFKHQTIESVRRMGKYLIMITTDHALVMHMRMEGRFFIKKDAPIDRHDHVIFYFTDGEELRYHDVRKFGRILIKDKQHYQKTKPLKEVAPEPDQIDPLNFYHRLHQTKRHIKSVLLDQTVIAGLGNIYVDETLFRSGIHPMKRSHRITKKEAETIISEAQKVLNKAIALGGSTIRTYHSTLGIDGRFQNELMVHTKKGLPCPKCGETIIKITVGGRGTYVCTTCQKR